MSALMGTALADKVTGETNKISAIYFGYGNGTGANVSAGSVANLTDGGYFNNNYSSWGTNTTLDTLGYNVNTYAKFGDSAERVSLDRVANDRYDMYMTLTLSEFTTIEKFYMTAHPEADLSPATYAVFVGNDTDTLYNAENRVFLFDAYNVYKNQNTWKYNGGISGTARGGESQYLEFTGDKLPVGKYVGVKIYDASTRASLPGCVSVADIGVFGDKAGYFATDYATYSFGSSSELDVLSIGKSGGAALLNANGEKPEFVNLGETVTYKAEPVTDSRHTFLGWYNGDEKVSGDMEITASVEEVSAEPSVAIIHDEAVANASDNTYATFARVNAAGKTVKEMGFIYVTGTTYGIVGDEGFTMAGVTAADRSFVQAKMPRTGADFMATLEGITKAQEVKRVARAYVIFEGDETVYYSNVVSKIFN